MIFNIFFIEIRRRPSMATMKKFKFLSRLFSLSSNLKLKFQIHEKKYSQISKKAKNSWKEVEKRYKLRRENAKMSKSRE